MQSFLQYRRFGRHVQRQYERDIHQANYQSSDPNAIRETNSCPVAGTNPLESDSSSPSTSTPDRQPDVEKNLPNTADLDPATSDPEERLDSRPTLHRDRTGAEDELTYIVTQQSRGTALGATLTGISVRDRATKNSNAPTERVFVVGYEGPNDPLNPHNWSRATRIGATVNIALIGWIVGFASSVDSGALPQAAADFGVSEVVESLATGLFLVGFGVGALFAGPISETLGRNPVYIGTLILYMIFVMASALAPNIGAQLTFRFIAGTFASTPLTCAGGSVSDLWSPIERTYAFPFFANMAFVGPIFGPVVSGFVAESKLLSWRWTEWITLNISGLILAIVALFQPETYAPTLLKWKAAKLREVTGDDRYRAEMEIRDVAFLNRLIHALYRPFVLFFSESIIVLIALYLTVIYIVLFTFLDGYTYIFTRNFHLSQGLTGLAFLGIGIGLCLSTCLVPLIYTWAKKELRAAEEKGEKGLRPEFRLWFAMLGAPAIPISLFWMGWTDYAFLSQWSPMAASILFGYGILCVFISSYQYIIDAYEKYAASALASATLIRYVAAGGSVVYAIPMYEKLGVQWTLTILGVVSALMVPVPYAFFWYGDKIRGWSRYAVG